MKELTIYTANGQTLSLPLFDPFVLNHINSESSYVSSLLHQINVEKLFAPFFAGKKDLTFLDLGANIGLVSIYASDACRRIVAVEPGPTHTVLKALTLKFPNIEPVSVALAPTDGYVQFFTNPLNATASSTVNTFGDRGMVNGLKLSSMLQGYQLQHVDICKVDVEGAEGESFPLGELQFASQFIDSYYIETHNCPKSRWEQKLVDLVWKLQSAGYPKITINGPNLYASK